MTRKWPLIPTIIVAAAMLTMLGLGIWQLQRADEKKALLARYEAAQGLPPIAFPTIPVGEDLPLFRRAAGHCLKVESMRSQAGRNRAGEGGYVHIADCATGAEGPGMAVELGWSKDPNAGKGWRGGEVSGIIGPDKAMRMRLVSATGLAGLEPSAPPSIDQIPVTPARHRGYAATWFALAVVALVIYWLALRKRQRSARP